MKKVGDGGALNDDDQKAFNDLKAHNELMKNCDVYKEIALSQLSEEEL